MGANGVLGWGFYNVAVRSLAAFMAALAEEVAGIVNKCGGNSTVLEIRLARGFGIYTLWHQ